MLATVAIAAWVTGVYLVSRLRCQDAEITEAARRVEEWFRSLFDSRGDQGFASAEAALQWQHWKFRIQPLLWSVGLFFGLFLTLVSLSIDDPRPGKDLEAFSVLFTFFPVLGGMITGRTMALFSNKASSDVIPSHLGVLPLSTRDFADVHLRSLINIGVGSLCLLGRELFGRGAFHERALDGWLYDQAGVFTLPLVLLMSLTVTWIVAGLTASLAWSGREKFTAAVSMMIIFSLIANLILFRFFLPTLSFDSPLRLSIHAAYALIAIGVLVALSTISARRQLLRLDRFSMAIAGWIAVGVASWIVLPWSIGHRCCVLLLLSMVALPFGAAPVALATNRHR